MAKILREELIREKSKQNTTNVNGETENTEGKPKKKKKRKKKKEICARILGAFLRVFCNQLETKTLTVSKTHCFTLKKKM